MKPLPWTCWWGHSVWAGRRQGIWEHAVRWPCGRSKHWRTTGPLPRKQPEDSEHKPGNMEKLTHQLITLEITVTSCSHWYNNMISTGTGECGKLLNVVDLWIITRFSSFFNRACYKVIGTFFHRLSVSFQSCSYTSLQMSYQANYLQRCQSCGRVSETCHVGCPPVHPDTHNDKNKTVTNPADSDRQLLAHKPPAQFMTKMDCSLP